MMRFEWFDLMPERAEFERLLKLGVGPTRDRSVAASG